MSSRYSAFWDHHTVKFGRRRLAPQVGHLNQNTPSSSTPSDISPWHERRWPDRILGKLVHFIGKLCCNGIKIGKFPNTVKVRCQLKSLVDEQKLVSEVVLLCDVQLVQIECLLELLEVLSSQVEKGPRLVHVKQMYSHVQVDGCMLHSGLFGGTVGLVTICLLNLKAWVNHDIQWLFNLWTPPNSLTCSTVPPLMHPSGFSWLKWNGLRNDDGATTPPVPPAGRTCFKVDALTVVSNGLFFANEPSPWGLAMLKGLKGALVDLLGTFRCGPAMFIGC
ncbi:hypothetical protein DFJ58DRAFT_846946 [Suillus subalutaceus]|uniref:uncharacterized protein n=1 Tax=Suillus subalutaceus TaxID=48586 RepID=UPI001B8695B1|nr:uncharacterized protein DFJ58DRAFT_846946 [Suillus subalutaceus]KAG1836470.1 hypothetical protein DFJ58DRAFT_846946 [Suillus subalutaceus]